MSLPLPEQSVCPLAPEGAHLRKLTRLALSQALRELSETSLSLVPTWGEEDMTPGSYSCYLRRVGVLYKRARVLAVLNDRIVLSATWEIIDKYLGTPAGHSQSVFASMEKRWREKDPAPWAPVFNVIDVAPERAALIDGHPIDLSDPGALAASLDRYCVRHLPRERGGPVGRREHLRQVSGGLPD